MSVIGLHRRGDGLLDAAPAVVAAVQALMDLDGLRGQERGRLVEHLNAMEHQLVMRDIDGARALLAKMRGSL